MCRWVAYSGSPLYLDELILEREHSLIHQSREATEAPTTVNADGFGVGWYDSQPVPGVYRSVRPAWNDPNLRSLAEQVRSPLFLAHVRSSTGTPVQYTNCHPFTSGPWLFAHNGAISEYSRLRRELLMAVSPALFSEIQGTTDSELMFYLALTFGLDDDPIGACERMAGLIERVAADAGVSDPLQMTLGLLNGRRLYAVRYSSAGEQRSLYRSQSVPLLREQHPEWASRVPDDAVAIVSEPLGSMPDAWLPVPASTALTVAGGETSVRPFVPTAPA